MAKMAKFQTDPCSKKKKWSKGKVKDRANNAVVLDKPTL
jgi:ribosomal protein S25